MCIKRTPSLIFYWELFKNLLGSYLFNMQIDGCFSKRTLLLEKMLSYNKSIGSFKMCITQEEGNEDWQKSNKKLGRRRVCSKKMQCYSLKKPRDFASDVLFDPDLFLLYSLWVYLLMMLLTFYETSKPYILKYIFIIYIYIYYIYRTRYLQNYLIIVCKESKEMNEWGKWRYTIKD